MARLSRLILASDEITSFFAKTSPKVYSEAQLRGLLLGNGRSWGLAESTSASAFISFLQEHGELKTHEFRSAEYSRLSTRYSWGKASPLELALSIKSRGYLCHGTAARLHGLIKHSPKTIYLNVEQTPKPSSPGSLTQQGIDLAFSRDQRLSNLIYACGGISVIIIAGKNTKHLGVKEMVGPASEPLQVTNLERTLIDIVVRPAYADGSSQVLKAYRAAKGRMSVDRLLNILESLDYVYPYHQSIGYLMQKAGYPERSYTKMRALGLNHDFYLAHGMQQCEYSEEWRLFYPRA